MRNPKPHATMHQNKEVDGGFHASDVSDADMHAIAAFRQAIDAFSAAPENRTLKRSSALALMKLVIEFLSALTDEKICPLGGLDPREVAVGTHPAIELLGAMRDAIGDLDIGKTHPELRPYSEGSNRSLLTSELKEEELHKSSVLIIQRQRGHKKRTKAAQEYVDILRKKGKLIKGKSPTTDQIASLFNHPKKPRTPRK